MSVPFALMLKKARFGVRIAIYLLRRFRKEEFGYRAASLAYTTLLAITPLAGLAMMVLSWFPFFSGFDQRIEAMLLSNFVAATAQVVLHHINHYLINLRHLSNINWFFLLLATVLMVHDINCAFNTAWHTHFRIHFTLTFLLYLLVLLFSPLVLASLVLLGDFIFKIPYLAEILRQHFVQVSVLRAVSFFFVISVFTLLNWVLPSCKVRFLDALKGGIVTAVVFESAKFVFSYYLAATFSSYRVLYGSGMATIPIFLVWLYVSWCIILLGALITQLLARGFPK